MRKKSKRICHVEHLELRRLLSTIYVSAAATGSNNGTSWSNAYNDLQVALAAATSGTTIEVGQGTYYPARGLNRSSSFNLRNGVTIKGGYAGTGKSNPDARDTTIYPSILSGDAGIIGDTSDNSYHVVVGSGTFITAVLDGFTISGGNANGTGTNSSGGGIFNSGGSPTINNCTISGNSAKSGGGIADMSSSAPRLTNCTISGNTATSGSGGGMWNYNTSSPIVTDCTLSGNTASSGGGAIENYNYCSPVLTNCTICGNTADHGGAIDSFLDNSPVLINVVISGNVADFQGGAMNNDTSSSPTLTNCTISGNSASSGGAIYDDVHSSPTVSNSILWGDSASFGPEIGYNMSIGTDLVTIAYSDIKQDGYSGNHNINSDPKFIRPSGAAGSNDLGDLRLQGSSPAVGAGNASGLTGISTDIDGLSRTVGGKVDMGAYESHYAIQSNVYVDATAHGAATGSDWADAYPSLAAALAYAVSGETIAVAQGTYRPSTDSNRFNSFQLVNGVTLQGGYAGVANPTAVRSISTYPTILSGDIGVAGDKSDNSYDVVSSLYNGATAVLDGFTVTQGNASGSNYHGAGGGIFAGLSSSTISNCTITGNTASDGGGGIFASAASLALTNCTISGNSANFGGGIRCLNSSPILTNCTISGNTANQDGGGFENGDSSAPILTNCTISGNTAADNGGGMSNYAYSSPVLANCTISGNVATSFGGGICNETNSSPVLINSILSGNITETGGGGAIYNGSSCSPSLTNCTLTENGDNSYNGGGAIYENNASSSTTLTNCVLWGDGTFGSSNGQHNEIGFASHGSVVTITYSDIDQNGYSGNHNINADPQFIGASTNNFTLEGSSPAINVGSNTAIPNGITTDQAGNARIVDATVDMGAMETPVHLVLTAQPPASSAAGSPLSLTIAVEDPNGIDVTNDTSSFAIALGTNSSVTNLGGTLNADASGGVANFSGISITAAGNYTIVASNATLGNMTSNAFTITPGAAAALVFSQQPANGTAGQTLSAVNVQVLDQYGNLVGGSNVTLALASGARADVVLGGTLTQSATIGTATFAGLSLNRASTYSLFASDGSLPQITSSSFQITYTTPQLIFAQEPTTAVAKSKFTVVVDAENTDGTLMTFGKKRPTIKLTTPSGKLTGSVSAKISANGTAMFKNVSTKNTGTFTLTATDITRGSSIATGHSDAFTVAAAPGRVKKKIEFSSQEVEVAHRTLSAAPFALRKGYRGAAGDETMVNLVLRTDSRGAIGFA